ncbi:MAG TPA: AAA family ATPase [Polyangiaceae bacterium]|nr:AAA family ATPase [Polyangiaceae bacterium]
MAELVGADHAQVIGHAVDAGSFVGQLRAARAVVATPWLQPAGGGSGLGRVVNLEGPVEPLRYWCRGLGIAWAGKVVGVHGYAGSSKGLFTSLLALGAAAGVPVLGHDVARTPVLYLDAETGKLAEIRIKRLRDGLGIDIGALQREGWFRFVHIDQTLVSLLPVIETTACELRKTEGILIVLDSYSSATGGDEISSEYADGLWALGQLGTRIGALPIVTLHERKQAMSAVKAPNPLEGISGTNRLAAALASSIRLTPDEENDRRILVTCTRAPAAKFEPFHLTWCGEGDEPLTATVEAAHVATARDRAATKQAVKESKASEKVRRDADTLEAVLRNTGGIPINTGKARTACGLDGKSWGPALVECQRRGTVRSTPGQNNSIDLVAVPIEEVGVGGFSVQRPVKPKPFDWEKFEPAFEALRRGKP